jgi:hypothetical protein
MHLHYITTRWNQQPMQLSFSCFTLQAVLIMQCLYGGDLSSDWRWTGGEEQKRANDDVFPPRSEGGHFFRPEKISKKSELTTTFLRRNH